MKNWPIEEMALEELKPADYNPRSITDKAKVGLNNSIDRFGMVQPIVWNKQTGNIVGGHQRYKVLLESGEEKTDVVIVDFPENEEVALNVALNNPAIQGDWTENIAELLGQLRSDSQDIFDDLNFDDLADSLDISDILAGLGGDSGSDGDDDDVQISEEDKIFDDEAVIESAFKYYRGAGFPFPHLEMHECMISLNRLKALPLERCIRSNEGYRVADTYQKHRLKAAAINMRSPYESFHRDDSLKKVFQRSLEGSGKIGTGYLGYMSIVSGTQACSNFRPAFAKYLYDKYGPKDGVVFDSSTGYGGRLVGFLASHCSKYIGTDPNKPTYEGNLRIAEDLGGHKEVVLFNEPAEDLDISSFEGQCDFAFTSPPYFCKEIYSDDDKQSWKRYSGYEDWLELFLRPMIQKNMDAIKPGSNFILNIEDVKIKGEMMPLVKPSIDIGVELGLEYVETFLFELSARKSITGVVELGTESVIVFRKP